MPLPRASHGWCCEGWPRKGEKIRGLQGLLLEDSATIFGYMKWRCTHVDGEENFRKRHQLRACPSLYSITYRVFIHPSAGWTINARGYVPLLVVECLHTDNIHLMIFPLFSIDSGPFQGRWCVKSSEISRRFLARFSEFGGIPWWYSWWTIFWTCWLLGIITSYIYIVWLFTMGYFGSIPAASHYQTCPILGSSLVPIRWEKDSTCWKSSYF